MTYYLEIERRPNAFGVDDRIWKLGDARGSFVQIAPALGFNCYRWVHAQAGSAPLELLWSDPNYCTDFRPTRSGFPILFPFPNRIRDGRFTWGGKSYELPKNDPAGANAIHGFVCRQPWRVIDQGADGAEAWLTGEFQGALDAPETLALWPADYRIHVTYRFSTSGLSVEAVVHNPGSTPLPFGLGYHPYFRLDPFGNEAASVCVPAQQLWILEGNVPTGACEPVAPPRDLRQPQPVHGLHLDDVFTDLVGVPGEGEMALLGAIQGQERLLQVLATPSFRELVAFIPPHRQALCLEPYTCTTDAINLQQRGVDAGWQTLAPGAEWRGQVTATFTDITGRVSVP